MPHCGGRAHNCWNCGGKGHGVTACKKPKDQKRIAENKQKWEAENGKSLDGTPSKGQYERKKWGSSDSNDTGHGVKAFSGVLHMLCNKGCGWNKTHTTGFHKQFLVAPSTFPAALPATHPYCVLVAKNGGHIKSSGSNVSPPPPPLSSAASSLTLTENQMVIDKSKWRSVLDHHERTSENAKVAALCTSLKELLN